MDDFSAIKKQIREWIKQDFILPKDIPDVELYMDQVTGFMDGHLIHNNRGSEDKTLTKAMINNYTKNKLLPPPVKKKYSKEHMMILILIYYFKNIMSIGDIQVLTAPLTAQYFSEEAAPSMQEIYDQVFAAGEQRMDGLKEDLYAKYETSLTLFEDVPKEDREYLQLFSYVCLLSYDIFIKKLLIERIVDEMKEQTQPEAKGKKEKNKSGKE